MSADLLTQLLDLFTSEEFGGDTSATMTTAIPSDQPGFVLCPAEKWCGTPDLEEEEPPATTDSEVRPQGFINKEQDIWPVYSKISYGFMQWKPDEKKSDCDKSKKNDRTPTPYRQKLVRDVMDYFEKHAAVKFERIPNHTNFMTNADFSKEEIRQQVDLRIAFGVPTAAGCWGWTGKPGPMIRTAVFENQDPTLPGPRYTTVYLGGLPSDAEWEKKMPKKDLETAMRTIYHELGHVCGLQHEHQSPQSPTVDAKDKSFPRVVATLFDEKSIMLYAGRPYKADPKRLTERTLFPSLTDECLLSIMYPFNADENRTFSVAIQHMNFSDKARKLMLDVLEKAFAQFPTIDHPTILKLRAAIAKEINLRPRLARLEKPDPDPRLNINFES